MISDLPNQVETGLYLGNMNHANDQRLLQRLRITHVLTLCQMRPHNFPSVNYRHISIEDHPSARIAPKFDECIKFIDSALSRRGNILVHCYAGVSRSATIIMAYLMKKKKLTYPEAMGQIHRVRPMVNPNIGFVQQLHDFSAQLQRGTR